jgi:hypothetical protein
MSAGAGENQGEGHTEYRSQITFANASTLNDDLHDHMHLNISNILREIAREGVVGVFPR